MKTIHLKKILWKNTMRQFFVKKNLVDKQVESDLAVLGYESGLEVVKARKRRKWLP